MITTNLSCLYNYGIVYVTNDYKYNYICIQGVGIMLDLDPQVDSQTFQTMQIKEKW
jgi:hypothetical protein